VSQDQFCPFPPAARRDRRKSIARAATFFDAQTETPSRKTLRTTLNQLEPTRLTAYDLRPMAGLRCNVVTPTESVLESEATYVEFPAWDGQKGVAPGAAPFLVRLGEGRLRIEKPTGGSDVFLLDGGFAQMNGGTLTILADSVTVASALKADDADKELAAANSEGLKRGTLDARSSAEHRQRLAYARVALARSSRR